MQGGVDGQHLDRAASLRVLKELDDVVGDELGRLQWQRGTSAAPDEVARAGQDPAARPRVAC